MTEALDDVVNPDPHSLRAAILAANSDPDITEIDIEFPESTMYPKAALPPVLSNSNLKIMGGQKFIDGSAAGAADGLDLAGDNIEVKGLGVVNFEQAGIFITGEADSVVFCALGTVYANPSLVGPDLSNYVGVYVDAVSSADISGCTVGNNRANGVVVYNSVNVSIDGCFIKDNGQDGVRVYGQANPAGGTTTTLTQNTILRNKQDGVHLIGSSGNKIGDGNVEHYNFIGVTQIGAPLDAGNVRDGIRIESAPDAPSTNNTISTNVIADNQGNGVTLTGAQTTANTIRRSLIGLGALMSDGHFAPYPLGNHLSGVAIVDGANGNKITEGNEIADNGFSGIRISDQGTSKNVAYSNYIGLYSNGITTASGEPIFFAAGNHTDGVSINLGATGNLIGGAGGFETGLGNVISGNDSAGVRISSGGTTGNLVRGNLIGTDTTGLAAMPNQVGVVIDFGAKGNGIGGLGDPTAKTSLRGGGFVYSGEGNVISGNTDQGVYLAGAVQNTVESNFIGVNRSGDAKLPNTGGVVIELGSTGNEIGTLRAGNVISGNHDNGVAVYDAGTSANKLQRNLIGLTTSGKSMGNDDAGVLIDQGASGNVVGGVDAAGKTSPGNVISENRTGVLLRGAGTSQNYVQGNRIGTDAAGEKSKGNLNTGVWIIGGASSNVVGGVSDKTLGSLSPANLISGNHFDGVRIDSNTSTKNVVAGNLIGTSANGLGTIPNTANGVDLASGATFNLIGGDDDQAGNLISGNVQAGVAIAVDANGNYVAHNRIGTSIGGDADLGNGASGVIVLGNANGILSNLISGNDDHGVMIAGSNNGVIGNRIGTDAAGTAAVKNEHDGLYINVTYGPGGNFIGASSPNAGNLISGNGWNGIEAAGPISANNTIENNRIGTNAAGTLPVGNFRNGVYINDTSGYSIGGSNSLSGNLISSNGADGVLLWYRHTTDILVRGNTIGTDASGTYALPNTANGVETDGGADRNVIGGVNRSEANLISGNALDGVKLGKNAGIGNKVLGNRIGTNAAGVSAVPNSGNGVELSSSGFDTVGGDTLGAGNLISGNTLAGVRLAGAHSARVLGNLVGTDCDGVSAVPNSGNGVELVAGTNNSVVGGIPGTGASAATPGNVISGNLGSGVYLSDLTTGANLVQGNLIGTTITGNAPLGNKGDGVSVVGGPAGNLIGGPGGFGPGFAGNVVTANGGDGLRLSGNGTSNNSVQGNRIGTYATLPSGPGNAGRGVWIANGAQGNSVGGLDPAKRNVIAYNHKTGVSVGNFVMDASTVHNSVLSNSIFDNAGIGIDLADNGVTPNAPGGPNSGPNQFQNYPVIDSASATNGTTTVLLHLNSAPSSSFTVQLFTSPTVDPTGFGEGRTLLVSVPVSTLASGKTGTVKVKLPTNLAGQWLTATATSSFGDTSEFGAACKVSAAAVSPAGNAATIRVRTPSTDSRTVLPTDTSGWSVAGPLTYQAFQRQADKHLSSRSARLTAMFPVRQPHYTPRTSALTDAEKGTSRSHSA